MLRRLSLPLLGLLLLAPPPALAARSACPGFHPGGEAPDLLRPALARDTRELCFDAFAVLHSGVSRGPLWAAERLTRASVAAARAVPRDGSFHEEARLPERERAELSDYARSGWDRGHMAPAGDMPSARAQDQSFSLSNIVPQDRDSNRGLWSDLEQAARALAVREGEVFVATGPIFEGETLRRVGGRVLVPTALWKAVWIPARNEAGAWVAPNAPGVAWREVSLVELEGMAGIAVFPALPQAVRVRAANLPDPRAARPAAPPPSGSSASAPRPTPAPAGLLEAVAEFLRRLFAAAPAR